MNLSIKRVDSNISLKHFNQIVYIENNSGFNEPYDEKLLMSCIEYFDTFVCLLNDNVIGYITLEVSDRYFHSIYIINISVHEKYRNKGICKALLKESLKLYQDDIKYVTLDVKRNSVAQQVYKKLGFQVLNIPSMNGQTDDVMYVEKNKLIKI